jgi:hypothetical protein
VGRAAVDLAHASRAEGRGSVTAEARAGREVTGPGDELWKRGFLRSGSKLGSIFSQAGETKYGIQQRLDLVDAFPALR